MQHAVFDVNGRRRVERAGQLRGDAQRIGDGRGSMPQRDVERFGGDVVLRQVGVHTLDSRGQRSDHGRMRHGRRDQPLEFGNELMHTLGRQVESKDYRTYIANLRGVGCPEATIKDIILTDLMKLFVEQYPNNRHVVANHHVHIEATEWEAEDAVKVTVSGYGAVDPSGFVLKFDYVLGVGFKERK